MTTSRTAEPCSVRRALGVLLPLLLPLLAAACGGVEDKRIEQLLNEKGFGSRAEGVATLQNYVAGGDAVFFVISPALYSQPGYEALALLAQPQPVSIDGTILIPYIGPVPILGLTEQQLTALVRDLLQPLFTYRIDLQARIGYPSLSKAFYAIGEAVRKGRIPILTADLTFFEAVHTVGVTQLANLGRIQLIRPDAQNPLVIDINFREMALTGNTTYNVLIQNNDIIYVPPTFFGMLTRFVQKLLEPLNVAVGALFGAAAVATSYDILTDSAFRNRGVYRF